MCHLKRDPNYNSIWKFWWRQYNKTNELVFSFYLLGRTYRTALQQMLKMSTTFLKTRIHPKCCYQSVYCCLIRYFLVRIRIAKCFTNSSKRFRYEVMFENEHTFAREYTMFAPAQLLRNWSEQRPSNKDDLDSSVTGEVGRVYYTGVDLLLFFFVP
jgi:hypothetical protein